MPRCAGADWRRRRFRLAEGLFGYCRSHRQKGFQSCVQQLRYPQTDQQLEARQTTTALASKPGHHWRSEAAWTAEARTERRCSGRETRLT